MREVLVKTEEFKDSAVERIPKDWQIKTLEECVCPDAQITYGIVQAGPHIEDGIPYIRTGDMAGDKLKLEGLLRTSPKIALSYRRSEVKTGEIVCAIRATVGKVLEVPPELDGANLTQGTARISPNHNINNRFLLWVLRSSYAQRQFNLAVKGTTFAEITLENLRKIKVPLPSSQEEQEKISAILDTVDEAIARTSSLIIKLKQTKAGLLQDLLTRGLDDDGKLRDPQAHPEQFKDSPLGIIPKEWEAKYLGQVLTSIDAGKSPNCPDIPASGKEWGVLKISAVNPNGFKAEENKVIINPLFINQNYEVKDGDLLITRSNTYELVGLTCLVINSPSRLLLCDKTLRLNIDLNRAEVEFIFYVLLMPYIRSQIERNATGSSAGMKNISQDIIKKFLVLLPKDLNEQNSITYLLNSSDNRIRAEEAYLNKLKLQKQGLMQDLLTGKVRVKNL